MALKVLRLRLIELARMIESAQLLLYADQYLVLPASKSQAARFLADKRQRGFLEPIHTDPIVVASLLMCQSWLAVLIDLVLPLVALGAEIFRIVGNREK